LAKSSVAKNFLAPIVLQALNVRFEAVTSVPPAPGFGPCGARHSLNGKAFVTPTRVTRSSVASWPWTVYRDHLI